MVDQRVNSNEQKDTQPKKQKPKRRHDAEDPIHDLLRAEQNRYAQAIRDAKQSHWEGFLKEIDEKTVWVAHKYVTGEHTDGANSKTLSLKTVDQNGEQIQVERDEEKADLFLKTFFPEIGNYLKPPQRYKYPPPAFKFKPITNEQIRRAIERLRPYKAPGESGVPNVVLMKTADLIIPILGPPFSGDIQFEVLPTRVEGLYHRDPQKARKA